MIRTRSSWVLGLLLSAATACTPGQSSVMPLTAAHLHGTDDNAHALVDADARFTVLEFFSASCDGQAAHDARLRDLHRRYHPRGVAFFAVDSEVDASVTRDAREAARRGYLFPILLDPGAQLADALGAEYSTYTVILDGHGRIVYRGAIDSDDVDLRDDATTYVSDALDDLLAGAQPRRAEGKTLGCALRVW